MATIPLGTIERLASFTGHGRAGLIANLTIDAAAAQFIELGTPPLPREVPT